MQGFSELFYGKAFSPSPIFIDLGWLLWFRFRFSEISDFIPIMETILQGRRLAIDQEPHGRNGKSHKIFTKKFTDGVAFGELAGHPWSIAASKNIYIDHFPPFYRQLQKMAALFRAQIMGRGSFGIFPFY